MNIQENPIRNPITNVYICKRCGWKWLPRKLETPKACPACQSKKWDITK